MSFFIGIDLGTSGIKALLIDSEEKIVARSGCAVAVSIPHLGWSEQDADLWVAAVWSCLDQLAATAPRQMSGVDGIGLSGQMLAALLLGDDLRPLRPAILWNDQRAIAEAAELLALCPDIGWRTNGTPDPGIVGPKLRWLARHEPEVMRRARMLMLTKDYVRLALTGEVASEPSDAGGTQLFDVAAAKWDAGLCDLMGWRIEHLPPLRKSWEPAGRLQNGLAERWELRPGIVVAAGAGDNMGSTLGAGGARPGDAVLTVGTSGVSCIVDAAFHPGPALAILTSAHVVPDAFLSMGVVMNATAALDWVARLTGHSAAAVAAAAEAFASPGAITEAPVFLPCLNGIRTPGNRPQATGRMEGLHPGVTVGMLGYAVMEGVAFQFADCIGAQRRAGAIPDRFVAVGGGTRSDLWLRLLAAALGKPVGLPQNAEDAGPIGAARLGAVASGQPVSLLHRPRPMARSVGPEDDLAAQLRLRRGRFDRLVASTTH